MTIRIHEADGSPYEHVVNLQESFTKLDILYNTKYKRLKRNKKNKEHVDVHNIEGGEDAEMDGVLLHCLGDVLQSDAEVKAWKLSDWTKDQEDRMMNEAFEWIRVDTDFEWICILNIGQPDYMFASQLQQDRDVVAQYDALRFFSSSKQSELYSSIYVKTLMDKRYFHGIRTQAAYCLAQCAIPDLNYIGVYHLKKAFQTLFCFDNSFIPKANDFSDFSSYFLQKAIPLSLSSVRNKQGRCPRDVQYFILDLLRYNDNTSNDYSDSGYITALISAIIASLDYVKPDELPMDSVDDGKNLTEFVQKATEEIDRCLRMDSWMPSVHNEITTEIIRWRENLIIGGYLPVRFEDLIQYTKPGNYTDVRLAAFHSLLILGGIYDKIILHYFFATAQYDEAPDLRNGLVRILSEAVGRLALKGNFKAKEQSNTSLMVVDDGTTMENRQEIQLRSTYSGAQSLLKMQLKSNIALKKGIMRLLSSKRIGLLEKRDLLDICSVIDDPKDTYRISLPIPRITRLIAERKSNLNIVIKRINIVEEKKKAEAAAIAKATAKLAKPKPRKISIVGLKKNQDDTPSTPGATKSKTTIQLNFNATKPLPGGGITKDTPKPKKKKIKTKASASPATPSGVLPEPDALNTPSTPVSQAAAPLAVPQSQPQIKPKLKFTFNSKKRASMPPLPSSSEQINGTKPASESTATAAKPKKSQASKVAGETDKQTPSTPKDKTISGIQKAYAIYTITPASPSSPVPSVHTIIKLPKPKLKLALSRNSSPVPSRLSTASGKASVSKSSPKKAQINSLKPSSATSSSSLSSSRATTPTLPTTAPASSKPKKKRTTKDSTKKSSPDTPNNLANKNGEHEESKVATSTTVTPVPVTPSASENSPATATPTLNKKVILKFKRPM